jgi:alkanesulfonate monooxygenase SsuD/methylene tetrahydromethanopterin reductase-like flavin-dependent oxidoreductase (luciferase family)
MEHGVHTFGELVPDPHTHQTLSALERLQQVIRMAILADEAGLDIFGFGEHHRLDIADYEQDARLPNALFVGSPQQIIDKLLYQYELFGHQRFIGQVDIGGLPFHNVAQTIELTSVGHCLWVQVSAPDCARWHR